MSIWQQPEIIRWSQILATSFYQLFDRQLITNPTSPAQLATDLFNAPFVIASHGTQADPILNYGNRIALELWELNWDDFTQTPSRLTAEPENQTTRANMLASVTSQGYTDNYTGIRISSTGRRFQIEQTIIWNLTDESGCNCGQAATFPKWHFL